MVAAPDHVALVETLASFSNIFMKFSGTMEGAAHTDSAGRRDDSTHQTRVAPTELDFYRPVFELLWRCFGEDRLIYGSNWPVCDHACYSNSDDYSAVATQAPPTTT